MKPTIEKRINVAFDEYRATAVLLEDLVRSREYPHEIVILACSRLDALANLAMTKKRTQRERFVSFLRAYSGKASDLQQVALPNLYFQLFLQFVTLPGTVPAAGRMCAFDVTRDAAFLQFVVDSAVAIEETEVSKLLHQLSAWQQRKYRTTVTQSKSKPHHDTAQGVIRHLRRCSRSYRSGLYDQAVPAFGRFMNNFRLADILYRDYRSRSIHDFTFDVDERFFTEPGRYVVTRFHAWDSTRFLEVCLSARWITDLYRESVQRFERSLVTRKKLPLGLWSRLCDENKEFEFLDEESIEVGRDLRIRVER